VVEELDEVEWHILADPEKFTLAMLSDDFCWRDFIFPQSEKGRCPQLAVAGPFLKCDLAN
jgi:hypothetical protein